MEQEPKQSGLENPEKSAEFGRAEAEEIERRARLATSTKELDELRARLAGRASGDQFTRAASAIDARRVELAEERAQPSPHALRSSEGSEGADRT